MFDVLMSIGAMLALLALALLTWGLLEPYRIDRQEHEAMVPGLPERWSGLRVALIADLHTGAFLANTGTARRIVRRIVAERPALVLVAGDFVHGRKGAAERAAEILRPLTRASIPTYAVLGNHDYAMPTRNDEAREDVAAAVRSALAGIGVRVLAHEAVELEPPGGERADPGETPLYLVGVGAHLPRRSDPGTALASVPEGAPRIVMMHHPASFEGFVAGTAPFAVAGHTHGGQIRLPFAPVWRYLTYVKDTRVYVAGWIASEQIEGYGRPGNRLYVNRGIGFSVAPLRVACPPELTVFTLVRPS